MPRSIKRETEYERARRRWVARVASVEECAGLPVVEGALARGELRVARSRARGGTTMETARMAAAVSRGEAFGGRATWRTNVLYLAADETPVEWAWGVRPELGETDRWFRVGFGPFELDTAEEMARLRGAVEFGGVGLVVVDPLRFAVGRKVLRRVLAGLEALAREKDVAVVAVHDRRVGGFGELGVIPRTVGQDSFGDWNHPLPHGSPSRSR